MSLFPCVLYRIGHGLNDCFNRFKKCGRGMWGVPAMIPPLIYDFTFTRGILFYYIAFCFLYRAPFLMPRAVFYLVQARTGALQDQHGVQARAGIVRHDIENAPVLIRRA